MDTKSKTILRQLSYPQVIAAMEANLTDFIVHCSHLPGSRVEHTDDHMSAITGISQPSLNVVMQIRLSEHQIQKRIAEIMVPFRNRAVPMLWWLFPDAQPHNLSEHLEQAGLRYHGAEPGMAMDLNQLPEVPFPSNFSIEEVNSEKALYEWIQVSARAFSDHDEHNEGDIDAEYLHFEHSLGWSHHSPYRRFLGRLNGRAVATAATFTSSGVAGLYSVGTLPDVRRQGLGRAISLAALQVARLRGYQISILQSSPSGYQVYRNIGFQEYSRIHSYLWWPE